MQQCTAKWVAFRKLFEFYDDASTRIRLGFSFFFSLPRTSHRGVIDVARMKTNFPPKNSIPPDYNWRRFCVGKGNISIKIVNQQRRESHVSSSRIERKMKTFLSFFSLKIKFRLHMISTGSESPSDDDDEISMDRIWYEVKLKNVKRFLNFQTQRMLLVFASKNVLKPFRVVSNPIALTRARRTTKFLPNEKEGGREREEEKKYCVEKEGMEWK